MGGDEEAVERLMALAHSDDAATARYAAAVLKHLRGNRQYPPCPRCASMPPHAVVCQRTLPR
jgi:hypothetical protein